MTSLLLLSGNESSENPGESFDKVIQAGKLETIVSVAPEDENDVVDDHDDDEVLQLHEGEVVLPLNEAAAQLEQITSALNNFEQNYHNNSAVQNTVTTYRGICGALKEKQTIMKKTPHSIRSEEVRAHAESVQQLKLNIETEMKKVFTDNKISLGDEIAINSFSPLGTMNRNDSDLDANQQSTVQQCVQSAMAAVQNVVQTTRKIDHETAIPAASSTTTNLSDLLLIPQRLEDKQAEKTVQLLEQQSQGLLSTVADMKNETLQHGYGAIITLIEQNEALNASPEINFFLTSLGNQVVPSADEFTEKLKELTGIIGMVWM